MDHKDMNQQVINQKVMDHKVIGKEMIDQEVTDKKGIDQKKLIREALKARAYAYAPYSNFCVGAALLGKDGKVYQGCNIENAGYTSTNCAERTAFFKAISEGVREFEAIAVVGSMKGSVTSYAAPCGVCRQVMMEFCDPETFRIIVAVSEEDYVEYTLEEMLPMGFGPKNLLD